MPLAHRITILLAFTASGFAGLIYESVWSHYLGLYLGHAAYAQTLTLGIFMGGMTLGAFFTSRYISRIRNALMGYAVAEFVLGVAGLLFHLSYTELVSFSYEVVFPGLGNASLISLYKWTSGALLILPQSVILGSTFPLLCSALLRREQQGIGRHISILYFTNSIGAAAGVLVAVFILLPTIGMPGAVLTAGIINIAIAIISYYISKHPEQVKPADRLTTKPLETNLTVVVLVAAAITGAVSFMYEIAWIRMLNLVLGTTLHAFEIMLSAFIAGLAFGGLWIRNRIDKIPNLLNYVGLVQIFMGLAAISTLILYVESFDWVATLLNETLKRTDNGYIFYNLTTSLISGLIMIPATFCAGMTLPLLTTHLIRNRHNENAIGRVYAGNTVGAICGIVFAVHFGMTTLGLKWLIVVAGTIDIGLGIYLIFYLSRSLKWISFTAKLTALCLIGLASLSLFTELKPSRLASGTFRTGLADSPNKILYYEDGKTASISVQELGSDGALISTNGKPDAGLRIKFDSESTKPLADEVTMVLAGLLALLIDTDVQDVANIGFGSGLTSHLLLTSPSIKTLDSIEIEPLMVEGARVFMPRNHLAYEDKRSNIHIDDAKTFFAVQQKKYNVIISEPSNPWVMGVGNLFTLEFYEHLKGYLKNDGLLVQWLQIYEMSLPTLLTALSSLNLAFENYELYAAHSGDIIIIATPQASTDISLKATWGELPLALKAELELVGLNTIESVQSRRIATKYEIDALIAAYKAPYNSDYFPLLSQNAPRDRFKRSSSNELFSLQTMGIFDNPYKNKYLTNPSLNPDELHLFFTGIKVTREIEDILLKNYPQSNLGFSTSGMLQTVTHPKIFCSSKKTRMVWIQAFNSIAMLANNFGTAGLRNRLLEYANQFDCIDKLEVASGALLNVTVMSLNKFKSDSSSALRKHLIEIQDSSLKPFYFSFIVSCYLSSLISDSSSFEQADLETIELLRAKFDSTNHWLEALLTKRRKPV